MAHTALRTGSSDSSFFTSIPLSTYLKVSRRQPALRLVLVEVDPPMHKELS
jgi:hypothetical protein